MDILCSTVLMSGAEAEEILSVKPPLIPAENTDPEGASSSVPKGFSIMMSLGLWRSGSSSETTAVLIFMPCSAGAAVLAEPTMMPLLFVILLTV